MTPSSTLIEWLLGIAEGVAAYGDQLDSVEGERLARAAREAIDRFWDETGGYPTDVRSHRDRYFALLVGAGHALQAGDAVI